MKLFYKFGKLTAIDDLSQCKSNEKISWLCDCGRKTIARIDHVKGGRIKTCRRCNEKDQSFWEQTKFGKLRMKECETINFGSGKKKLWVCDCGKETLSSVIKVTSGKRTSCGKCNIPDNDFWKQKFGKLKRVDSSPVSLGSNKKVKWICDCGNLVFYKVSTVTSGLAVKCGSCNSISADQIKELKFGKLRIKNPINITTGSQKKVKWICDCGKEATIKIFNVIAGVTTSCNKCELKDKTYWETTKFGQLKMLKPNSYYLRSHQKVDWICDCGQITKKIISNVTTGNTNTCGTCHSVAVNWYLKNQEILKNLSAPIYPSDIPEGGLKALEPIYLKYKQFLAICPICNHQYKPRWDMIRQGESITCGCTSLLTSKSQIEIAEYIRSLGFEPFLEYKINKYKYDIYVNNLIIEYHGLKWHSNKESKNLDRIKYELIKNDYNYLLIFEDEWKEKKEIIKSIIKNKLGVNKINNIKINKCVIHKVDSKIINEFYQQYHYIGKCTAKMHYGVYFDTKLIAAISFGKPTRQTSKYEWELLRMCSHPDYRVHGIWSKLLKLFIKEHNSRSIVSFSDNRLFNGKVYEKLGFKLDGLIPADYYWTKDRKRFHKSGLRKTKNEKLTGLTETQLREQQGFTKIWDLGKTRWILVRCDTLFKNQTF